MGKKLTSGFCKDVYRAGAAVAVAVLVGALAVRWKIGTAAEPPTSEPQAQPSQPAAKAGAADAARAEFTQAGVCARCHVVSVLEWSISGHVAAKTNCQSCHGSSRGHVANERNEVKPDRLPRGAQIAKQLCSECHEAGCPSTQRVGSCQECHHVHALVNPAKPPVDRSSRLEELLVRWDKFGKHFDDGERQVKRQDWQAAQQAFRAALELIPGNQSARRRLEMCTRRLNPSLPGFEIVGEAFDPQTGLPKHVRVVGPNIEMLLVPSGEFDMGSDKLTDAGPVHTVRVEAFYLGQFEVTQAEWATLMGDNPSIHQGEGFPDHERMPVENVSWNDCQEFLRRLNAEVPGGGFRLPSEAEWEYAAAASQRQPPKTLDADADLSRCAWYRANSMRKAKPEGRYFPIEAYAPRPVGTRQPNARGFYDLQGNVNEWCSSLFRPYLYDRNDGRESASAPGMRVVRGGGFADSASSLDPALRHAERPHRRLRWNGLRLARSVPPPGEASSPR